MKRSRLITLVLGGILATAVVLKISYDFIGGCGSQPKMEYQTKQNEYRGDK